MVGKTEVLPNPVAGRVKGLNRKATLKRLFGGSGVAYFLRRGQDSKPKGTLFGWNGLVLRKQATYSGEGPLQNPQHEPSMILLMG